MSSIRVDGVFRTRTLGVAARGIPDQYADGKAAKIWHKYIGDEQQRTGYYKNKLLNLLREHKVHTVLDVACGTGVDSVFLVEEGFAVTSVDGSDKMLKYALKVRWARRKEPAFDKWVIEEGNWLSLNEADIEVPEGGFDALICMGNSFAHLPDFDENQAVHIQAIQNFRNMLKTGGILVIDHRNYDHILAGGTPPMKNIYYQVRMTKEFVQTYPANRKDWIGTGFFFSKSTAKVDVKTSVLAVDGQYRMVTLDYCIHGVGGDNDEDDEDEDDAEPHMKRKKASNEPKGACKFRLSYYPHQLKGFNKLLKGVFGEDAPHTVLADFEPLESLSNPAYFIHIITKQ